MEGFPMKLDERVKRRIETLKENDEIVQRNEIKIKEIECLMKENESIISENHKTMSKNKDKINFYKSQINNNEDSIMLASKMLKISEDNLELCKDNLSRTLQDRDRIVEIQEMCIKSTEINKKSLIILQDNISEMVSIAHVLLYLTENDNREEETWNKNALVKKRNNLKGKQNLIDLLQLLFDKRETVFNYKTHQTDDQFESNKRKTLIDENLVNKRRKLISPYELEKSSEKLFWLVENISRKIKTPLEGNSSYLLSDSFYSHDGGYKLGLCLHFNGYGSGWGTHLCISYHLKKGDYDHKLEWPFKGTVTIVIVNQTTGVNYNIRAYNLDSVPNSVRYILNRPCRSRNVGWGDSELIKLQELKLDQSSLLLNDSILIKCYIDL